MSRRDDVLTREFRLLAACVRPPDDPAAPAAVRACAADPIDWPALLDLAERHRVVPGLVAGLDRAGVSPDPAVAGLLRSRHGSAVLQELALAATTRRLLASFAEAAIPVVVLKSVPLSFTIHGRLGMRTSRDIDLLVAPPAAAAALDLLARAGFVPRTALSSTLARLMRRHKDIETVDPESGQVIELHWRLFDNPRLLPLDMPLPFREAALDASARCAVLPERLNLLYLCNHGTQHAWSRLKWLADAAALLFRIGAEGRERLYADTSLAEGRRAIGQTLLLCEALFAMPIPPALAADMARDRRLGWLLKIAIDSLTRGGHRELEVRRFGSTVKNLSHYLVWGDLSYLAAEAWFDLNDMSALPSHSRWRWLGAFGRIGSWLGRIANDRA